MSFFTLKAGDITVEHISSHNPKREDIFLVDIINLSLHWILTLREKYF